MGLDNAIIEMVLKKYLFVKNYVLDVLRVIYVIWINKRNILEYFE